MATAADWYFDFVSPYSYLQCERLLELPLPIRARPLVFAGLLGHWGQKGPAEMVSKRRFTYEQVVWLARRDAIALRFPPRHPFNPIKALRLAVALGSDIDSVRAIFRYIWRDGGEFESPEGWKALCQRVRVDDGDALVSRQEVKDELRANGEAALAAGVFGVPTLVIDGRIFWGYDATPMAHEYILNPERFDSGEMRRVAELPVGAQRK
jgi:2-hydroxychromene-2-carboxylate isomerase